ncbi:MAG: SGNH/GDSL hydrolase family protein [Brachybacterium sp.]|uniref:SGNH/GDSL hydrolase family protein n=1 Tax=Brachybacterium sp. AOP42-E1-35 TaxID=3457664 RepID=UPI003FBA0D11
MKDDVYMRTEPVSALQDRMAQDEPMTWSFIGDSVTAAGWHTFGHRGYVELVNERLRELGRRADIVINAGHSGWQVGSLQSDLPRIALRFSPDVVVIGIGINDTKNGLEGLAPFKQGYRSVVERLREAGVEHIIAQTPNGTLPTAPDHVVEHLSAYSAAIRKLADELDIPLVDHDDVWSDAPESSWFHWLGHGCHPNAAGHRVLAREIFRALNVWDPENSRTCGLHIP